MTEHIPPHIDWLALMPMICVFGAGVVAMMLEMLRPRRTNNAIVGVSLAGLLVAGYYVIQNWNRPSFETFGGLYINDRFGLVVQLALIAVTFITLLHSEGYLRESRVAFGEYYPLILWATTGGMIMATSRDLLIIFLGLEVLSISLYILAGLNSTEKKSQEAALKYFLLGAFSSAFLLYGISLIYGATGTTHVFGISPLLVPGAADAAMLGALYAGLGLLIVGFAFKVALVPFHMWTPDVYQGAPTTVTGYMAAGSKLAAFAALIRFLDGAMDLAAIWIPVLASLAALTMTVGNVVALVQKDVKRILAYSSIAQAGYVLVAIVAYGYLRMGDAPIGYNTILYYLIAYGLMTLGAFAVLSLATRGARESTQLEDLRGMWRRAPFLSWCMVVFMVSLAGLPPLAGFIGKLLIFLDALQANMLWLALVLAVNSVVSAYYYIRIVLAMVVESPGVQPSPFAKPNAALIAVCGICAFLLIAMVIGYQPLADWLGLGPPTPLQAIR